MWVADMDFATAPAIRAAIEHCAAKPIFGYVHVPDSFANAISRWWGRRHGWVIDPAAISFCAGVVPAISSLVRTFAPIGSKVLLQTPVYNCFFTSVVNSERQVLANELLYDAGVYRIDWDDLEAKLSAKDVSLMILCNPQNPTGNVWTADELSRIAALACANDVVVVSDEIHCDLTLPGVAYTPFAQASPAGADCSITLVAPTKAFNIAGIQSSAVIAPSPRLRTLAGDGLNRDELQEANFFAIDATLAAFNQSEDWLEELREQLAINWSQLEDFLAASLPTLRLVAGQATYLPWVDCRAICDDSAELTDFIRQETGLFINPGTIYGSAGECFVRINIACPPAQLADGLTRLARGVELWLARGSNQALTCGNADN